MTGENRWSQGTQVGNWVVERFVARGGMGEVYRAHHHHLERKVGALKTLPVGSARDVECIGRFRREANTLASIDHPNVVGVLDFGVWGPAAVDVAPEQTLYLVMEWLDGETLEARLQRAGALPEAEIVRLLLQLCAGVAAAHALDVVHRDLKPDNIFLVPKGGGVVAKVADFGIASAGQLGHDGVVTRTTAVLGTVLYMSPEQWVASAKVTPASDQFSLGVIAYRCATGCLPFELQRGEPWPPFVLRLQSGQFRPPRQVRPEISPGLEQVIVRMLAPRQEDRFPDVRAVGRALLPLADEATRARSATELEDGAACSVSSPAPEGAAIASHGGVPVAERAPQPTTLGGSVRLLDRDRHPPGPPHARGRWVALVAGAVAAVATVGVGGNLWGPARVPQAPRGAVAAPVTRVVVAPRNKGGAPTPPARVPTAPPALQTRVPPPGTGGPARRVPSDPVIGRHAPSDGGVAPRGPRRVRSPARRNPGHGSARDDAPPPPIPIPTSPWRPPVR